MVKKRYIALPIILILILVTYFSYPYLKPLKVDIDVKSYKESQLSSDVKSFVEKHLSREDGGIYTNHLDKENMGDETKGHYILSESQGLLMEYALMTNDLELFEKSYKVVKDYMILDNNLVSWRISKANEKNETSALIDELRIARCLIEGYIKFDKFQYKFDAVNLSKAMLKNSTYDKMVSDFNDGTNKASTLTLCYIDLKAFDLLKSIDSKWKDIKINGKEIIEKGRISDDFPLFRKSFDLSKKQYSSEGESELLYSLMVWENLIKTKEDAEKINKWIKDQLKEYGCLYTKYNISSNKPVDYIESTSIYSVALRIAIKGEDTELQEKLYNSLMKYNIKQGELKGGFGMEKTKEAYSFDNLEAMISLIEYNNKPEK